MSELLFDEATHTYRLDGRVIDSVTTILKPLSDHIYRGVDQDVMDAAANLGTAVHKMIELDILGTLDVDSLHEKVAPYYPVWKRFLSETGFKPIKSEQRIYCKEFDYAGTLDLYGELNGKYVLADTKRTTAIPATAGPQTAAYARGLEERSMPVDGRYVLQMLPNDYRFVNVGKREDFKDFLACLRVHNWKKNK